MAEKPKVNSAGERELQKAEAQFKAFDENVQSLTLDRMNQSPKLEVEEQTKMSQKDIADSKDIYLKPFRSISSAEKFNENYREEYNFAKEYVYFIAENHEIIGEDIDAWTKPFAGMPAEWWKVPVNKPVWGPRYLAERIKGCQYHRLSMKESVTSAGHEGQYYGQLVADTVISRLDARPATKTKSIFMGAHAF